MNPLVSVVVPMYNDCRTIELCLRSVLAQLYEPIEVIVVDDASTDGGASLTERYPCRLIRAVVNRGPGATRNLGVQNARGEIIFFIDADMTMDKGAVATAVRILQNPATQYGAVFGVPSKTPLFAETLVGNYRILQYHYWRRSAEGLVSGGFYALGALTRRIGDEVGWFNPALRHTEEIDHAERLSRRYPMLLTSAISGRLSDESYLIPLLRKAFRRSRLRVPFYVDRGRAMRGMETRGRAVGAVLAASGVAGLPLLAVDWLAAPVSMALFTAFVVTDLGQYRFVRRERGWAFLVAFTVLHIAMNTAVAAGLAAGLAQWIVSRRFRQLYRTANPMARTP